MGTPAAPPQAAARAARQDIHEGDRRITCELRCHGEYGWETQTLENGQPSTGQRFETFSLARQCSDSDRAALEQDGWTRLVAPATTVSETP